MPPSFLALTLILAAAAPPAVSIRPHASVHAADELARRRLAYLTDRSATMKQVLEALERAPDISVRVRSNAILWREAGRKANGRFWRAGAHVLVLLQFDSATAKPMEQIEWVAHEMAHAVEVACLPRAIDIDGLAGQLLRSRPAGCRRDEPRHRDVVRGARGPRDVHRGAPRAARHRPTPRARREVQPGAALRGLRPRGSNGRGVEDGLRSNSTIIVGCRASFLASRC